MTVDLKTNFPRAYLKVAAALTGDSGEVCRQLTQLAHNHPDDVRLDEEGLHVTKKLVEEVRRGRSTQQG